jgi:hypothetical protein
MQTKSINIIILSLSFLSPISIAQYWAELDYSSLKQNKVSTINVSNSPLKCKIRMYNDAINFHLGVSKIKNIPVVNNIKPHEISLFCKPITKATRGKAWRIIN